MRLRFERKDRQDQIDIGAHLSWPGPAARPRPSDRHNSRSSSQAGPCGRAWATRWVKSGLSIRISASGRAAITALRGLVDPLQQIAQIGEHRQHAHQRNFVHRKQADKILRGPWPRRRRPKFRHRGRGRAKRGSALARADRRRARPRSWKTFTPRAPARSHKGTGPPFRLRGHRGAIENQHLARLDRDARQARLRGRRHRLRPHGRQIDPQILARFRRLDQQAGRPLGAPASPFRAVRRPAPAWRPCPRRPRAR